jgi:hypothetical protein
MAVSKRTSCLRRFCRFFCSSHSNRITWSPSRQHMDLSHTCQYICTYISPRQYEQGNGLANSRFHTLLFGINRLRSDELLHCILMLLGARTGRSHQALGERDCPHRFRSRGYPQLREKWIEDRNPFDQLLGVKTGDAVVTLPRQPQRIPNRVEQCPLMVRSQNSIPV